MFFNKDKIVLDFGSQYLKLLVGKMTSNGLSLSSSAEAEYAGYMQGEFIELDKLGGAIKQVIALAQERYGKPIKELYVGVPAEFCTVKVKCVSQNFEKRIKIKQRVLNELYFIGDDFSRFTTHRVISANLVSAYLDDGKVYTDILGEYSSSIESKLAYVLAERKFTDVVESLLKILGIKVIAFASSALAQVKYLFNDKVDEDAVLFDIGHITSSVSYIEKGSLIALNEFSLGGGFITADIMDKLNIPFDVAENLKKKVVLSFTPQANDFYEVKNKNEIIEVSAITVNNIVRQRIAKIIKSIYKSLQLNIDLLSDSVSYYITGGGLCYIKGAKDILSNAINADIQIVVPDMAQLDKPNYTSSLGLLYLACEYTNMGIKL